MKTVRISADLERRLRASPEPLVKEIVGLLDAVGKVKSNPGLTYAQLVAEFRQCFGAALVLPPAPSGYWIARQVNRAKELGLNGEHISRLSDGVRKAYPRGPWELEFLLRQAPRLIAAADAADSPQDGQRVFTGRPEED